MTRWLAALIGLAACSEDVHQLRIFVDEPVGFLCVEDDDPDKLLLERAFDQSPAVASIVVDFLDLGGIPGCRIQELLSWCEDQNCAPLAQHRVCIDLDIGQLSGSESASEILEVAAAQLDGQLVTADAPQRPVVIRAIAVAEPCSAVPRTGDLDLTCERLMGCAYSCPVDLGEVDGDVVLDLDFVGNMCEQAVEICASSSGFRLSNTCD